MTIYILGAGPAGMALAHGLALREGPRFVLLERSAHLGGLATTLSWDGHGRHDLGPHKLFTKDAELMQRVESLLAPADWLTRDKISSIYLDGHFLPYPPSPFSLSRVFGLPAFLRMTAGYGLARLRGLVHRGDPGTFEADLIGRLGRPLYEVLFKPIALKLWGDPRELDVKLSQGRVQTPSLVEVLARMLRLRRSSDFEALTFRYPRGGLLRLWEAIQEQAGGHGEFRTGHTITGIDVRDGRVRAIACRSPGAAEDTEFPVGPQDWVVSSLPLGLLPGLMREGLSARTRESIGEVVALNDLLLVFLKIDQPRLLPESWVFVPDQKIVFHRVSEQESFDPDMTPNGSIVCCEIMSHAQRPLSESSDEALAEMVAEGLRSMGYTGFHVVAQRVVRLPRSYPVYRPGYEPALNAILGELDGIGGFRSVGRQGAFNYIGTLDAMDIGYGAAHWLADGAVGPWSAERERTGHYPVLD